MTAIVTFERGILADLSGRVLAKVRRSGFVIIKGMPTTPKDDELVTFALALGKPSGVAQAGRRGAEDVERGFVHSVEALDQPLVNSDGSPILSTAAAAFKCHTDEYFMDEPCDLVLLHCIVSDPNGGVSLLANVRDVIANLDPGLSHFLRQPIYPHPSGLISILAGPVVDPTIRFNSNEIRGYYRSGRGNPHLIELVMSGLEIAIAKATKEFPLESEDCLIIDNKRVLHGRTSFGRQSNRLLKRVRLRIR